MVSFNRGVFVPLRLEQIKYIGVLSWLYVQKYSEQSCRLQRLLAIFCVIHLYYSILEVEMFLLPKDIYLGVLMSTMCRVHVGGWVGVGACSAEG